MDSHALIDIVVGCIILIFGGILSTFGWLILRAVKGIDDRFKAGDKRMDGHDVKIEKLDERLTDHIELGTHV